MAGQSTSDSRDAARREAREITDSSPGPGALSTEMLGWFNRCIDDTIDWYRTLLLETERREYLEGRQITLGDLSLFSRELGLRPGDGVTVTESIMTKERRQEMGERVCIDRNGKQYWIPLNDAIPADAPKAVQNERKSFWDYLMLSTAVRE